MKFSVIYAYGLVISTASDSLTLGNSPSLGESTLYDHSIVFSPITNIGTIHFQNTNTKDRHMIVSSAISFQIQFLHIKNSAVK